MLAPRPMFDTDNSAAEFLACFGVVNGLTDHVLLRGHLVVDLVTKGSVSSCLGGLCGGVSRGEGG